MNCAILALGLVVVIGILCYPQKKLPGNDPENDENSVPPEKEPGKE